MAKEMTEEELDGLDVIAFVPISGPYEGINVMIPIGGVAAVNTVYNVRTRQTDGMVVASNSQGFVITASDAVRLAAELEARHTDPLPGNLTAFTRVMGSA